MRLLVLFALGWGIICSLWGWYALAVVVLAHGPDLFAADPVTRTDTARMIVGIVAIWFLLQAVWWGWLDWTGTPRRRVIIAAPLFVVCVFVALFYLLGGPFTGGGVSATFHP